MYNNKHIITAIILGLIAVIIVSFITTFLIHATQGVKKESSQITLNMVGYKYTASQMQPLIDTYQKTNPNISINYIQTEESTYKNYLVQRFKTPSAPDIFEAKSSDMNAFLKYSHGSPSNILNAQTFKQTYQKLYYRGLLYNNSIPIGIPEDMNPLILVFNKSILAKNGFSIKSFTTDTDTFNQNIASLAKKDSSICAVNIGYPKNISAAGDILQLFMLQNGTQMNSINGAATFNDSKGAIAVKYYNTFINGDFAANWNSNVANNDINQFGKGKCAMIFAYPSQINEIKQINKNIDLGYGIYPSLVLPQTIATYNYFGVYAKTQNSIEAWKFLSYLSSAQNMQTLYGYTTNPIGNISPRKDTKTISQDALLASTLNQAAEIAIDWNYDGYLTTQDIFKQIIIDTYNNSDPLYSLSTAVDQINTNLQKALSL